MLVCRSSSAAEAEVEENLASAFGKLLRFTVDDTPLPLKKNALVSSVSDGINHGLEWTGKAGVVVMGLYLIEAGVQIFQYGQPLPLDACASGTQSERSGLTAAGKRIVERGLHLSCTFRGYAPGVMTEWKWTRTIPQGYREPHLTVLKEEKEDPGDSEFNSDAPTVVTAVTTDDPKEAPLLHAACVAALRRCASLLYKRVPDPEERSVAKQGWGSWQHSDTYQLLVPKIGDHDLQHPPTRGVRFVSNDGMFYEADEEYSRSTPPDLVIEVPEGMSREVFSDQSQKPCPEQVSNLLKEQMCAFLDDDSVRPRLVKAFLPLMNGGSSLLLESRYCGPLFDNIVFMFREKLQDMLLFHKLLPGEAKKEDACSTCQNTVCALEEFAPKVKYLLRLIGDRRAVVSVPDTVNPFVFYCVSPQSLEKKAAHAALARQSKDNFSSPAPWLGRAIHYVTGGKVTAVRAVRAAPDAEEQPYDFCVNNVLVYAEEDEKLLNILCLNFRENLDENLRSTAFQVHWNKTENANLPLESRSENAIAAAEADEDYNLPCGKPEREEENRDVKRPKVEARE